mmetsp:Transcript_1793/g.5644  ORF Transcript_1793/g.5644 Transcript_1793/m.5644 type:complete len:356 (-) Transcript_1793:116-1183(-)
MCEMRADARHGAGARSDANAADSLSTLNSWLRLLARAMLSMPGVAPPPSPASPPPPPRLPRTAAASAAIAPRSAFGTADATTGAAGSPAPAASPPPSPSPAPSSSSSMVRASAASASTVPAAADSSPSPSTAPELAAPSSPEPEPSGEPSRSPSPESSPSSITTTEASPLAPPDPSREPSREPSSPSSSPSSVAGGPPFARYTASFCSRTAIGTARVSSSTPLERSSNAMMSLMATACAGELSSKLAALYSAACSASCWCRCSRSVPARGHGPRMPGPCTTSSVRHSCSAMLRVMSSASSVAPSSGPMSESRSGSRPLASRRTSGSHIFSSRTRMPGASLALSDSIACSRLFCTS